MSNSLFCYGEEISSNHYSQFLNSEFFSKLDYLDLFYQYCLWLPYICHSILINIYNLFKLIKIPIYLY